MGNLVWYILIIVGCVVGLCLAGAVLTKSILDYRREIIKKRQAEIIEEKEETISVLQKIISSFEGSLLAEQSDNGCRRQLLTYLAEGCKGRSGKVSLYVFDYESGERLYKEAGRADVVAAFTDCGEIPLRTALEAARCELQLPITRAERHFTLEYTSVCGKELYLVTDITDNYRAEGLTTERDILSRRLDGCDVFTDAMELGSFVKKHEAVFKENPPVNLWLLYMRTEPAVLPDELMSNFDESYLKLAAELLGERFGVKNVARCTRFGLCAFLYAFDEEMARRIASEVEAQINERRAQLWPVDQRFINRNVFELAYYDGSDLADFIYAVRIRARVDMQKGNAGINMFSSSDVPRILGYKNAIGRAVEKREIRFTYSPIINTSNGKVFAYEMIPVFPSLSFSSLDELLYRARLFSLTDELEDLLFGQAMMRYDRAIKNLKMLPGTRVLIKSFAGACMMARCEEEFKEKNYDLLPNMIAEFSEELPGAERVAEIKHAKIVSYGAWSSVRVDQNSERNGMKVAIYDPQIVRISVRLLDEKKYEQRIRDAIARLHAQGRLVLMDEITKPQDVNTADEIGADLLQGEYVSRPVDDPGEASDKCLKRIAQIRFGKRR